MKKLLIWDADNTLWNGTLTSGDTPTLPAGRLEQLKTLHERGVVQSIASFNLMTDIAHWLRALDIDQYFLYPQAELSGRSKSDMVASIMNELDLAKPSDIVFVDDELYNRDEVASMGVIVIRPNDLTWAMTDLFSKDHYTPEDKLRVRSYEAQMQRKADAIGVDRQKFLADSDIRMHISPATDADMPRIADLMLRANRMAAIDKGYDTLEALTDERRTGGILTVRVADKYGNYGLSGVAIFDRNRAVVHAIVISCRLQNMGIGSALLGHMINIVAEYNKRMLGYAYTGKNLTAHWIETQYNLGMRKLYEWYGCAFNVEYAQDSSTPVAIHATHDTVAVGKVVLPTWITVTVGDENE